MFETYYPDFTKNDIVTDQLFYAVRFCEESLERSLVVEFRQRLEKLLTENKLFDVKFHPVNWRYHRRYYKQWLNNNWRTDTNKSVFIDSSFINDSRFNDEIKFDSLTDDEKIKIVVPDVPKENFTTNFVSIFSKNQDDEPGKQNLLKEPERFGNLTKKRKQEIIDNWKKKEKPSEGFSKDDNPYEFERWAYDIYSLYTPYKVEYSLHDSNEDFEFFFSWRLRLTDLFQVEPFLNHHSEYFSRNSYPDFKKYLEILLRKYLRIFNDENLNSTIRNYLENNIITSMETKHKQVDDKVEQHILPKMGRKVSEKIEIPKPPRRDKEKWTILKKEDTIKVFALLVKLGVFINDDQKLSKESIAKAMYALTGYSDNNTAENFMLTNKVNEDKSKMLKALIALIERGLE